MVTRYQFRQIAVFLFCGSVAPDLVHAQVGVRSIRQADRCRRARNLFHRNDMGQVTHRTTAVVWFDSDAQEAQGAHLFPQVGRELVGTIDLGGTRRDFSLRKLLNDVA
jgi:hypothetical protein